MVDIPVLPEILNAFAVQSILIVNGKIKKNIVNVEVLNGKY
jgi:hypothetical protein